MSFYDTTSAKISCDYKNLKNSKFKTKILFDYKCSCQSFNLGDKNFRGQKYSAHSPHSFCNWFSLKIHIFTNFI